MLPLHYDDDDDYDDNDGLSLDLPEGPRKLIEKLTTTYNIYRSNAVNKL